MKFKKSFYLIALLFSNTFFSQITSKVVGIKDGDTIVVLDDNNNQITLRLAEVDCPESGQPFGKNAKQFTSSQVFGKTVKYYPTNSDRYGRIVAKVYYDGKYLSEEIIKAGLGWWYYRYSDNKNLGKLQDIAKNKKLGLWSHTQVIPPWEFRRSEK
ncbi:Endonuclease YncB, thermonuclease family [Chryseobacterium carnipullorum]|uniref:thermonuclease family protein n=1 Tax=Chryseobacterium carnipullorum TaxID=1124835 RepID=UPI000915C1CC|nr:thermonuclease family protein [Chryseobacterium carnipullorum]SHN00795.1 Endonuclease YncB, thermonuclease family [Chryseobacterium carnipullorum]